MNLVFYEMKNRMPMYTAEVPEGFSGEISYTMRQFQVTENFAVRGTAGAEGKAYRLYFQNGEGYSWSSMPGRFPEGARNEEGVIIHGPCYASQQLDEYASAFAGQPLNALQYYDLTERKCALLQPEMEREQQKLYQIAVQVASISPMPMNMQVQSTVNDGGTGKYMMDTPEGRKTLLVTLWRCGLQTQIMPQGLNLSGMYAQMAQPVTLINWSIPLVFYLLSDSEPDEELTAVYNRFYESFDMTPEFRAYSERLEQQNLQRSFQAAQMQNQRTQAEINYAWQQQQAGWARSDALRRSLSQDLDSFRAGLNSRMADYDRLHAPGGALYSSGAPSMDYGGAGESVDDRIQRLRHESMMGVNTYMDSDGREVEFSTQADRVFQNDLDNRERFGTEHYYDNYVPDGWSELFRKY